MSDYLKEQLRESLAVVDTCLECIYEGKTHMYRALAGQLRLMLCDTQRKVDNSLIRRAHPKLELSAIREIGWSSDDAGFVRIQGGAGTNRIAQMPFEVTRYANGLAVADVLLDKERLLSIADWASQRLTFQPERLSISTVIRTVADKGGGAHVDSTGSTALRLMYAQTPAGRTYAELFVVGVGRFVQRLGERLYGYEGCRVPTSLTSAQHEKLNLIVVAHHEATEL
jgi:hypothetical protein